MKSIIAGICAVVLLASSSRGGGQLPHESVGVVVELRDGSKLLGTVAADNSTIELVSDALGKLSLPLNRIDKVEFAKAGTAAVLSLQNGDKVKGDIQLRSLKLQTSFGPVAIPVTVLSKLQFRTGVGGTGLLLGIMDWQALPFPENCDWPGNRGLRSKVDDEGIYLQGQPVCTVRSFKLPLELECEFTLPESTREGGELVIMQRRPGTAEDMYSEQRLEFHIGASDGIKERSVVQLSAHDWTTRSGRLRWSQTGGELVAGKPNRLKLEIGLSSWKVTLNDESFTVPDFRSSYDDMQVELWQWQPASRWLVRNVVIRPVLATPGPVAR